jgi:hypothetical protein
MSKNSKRREENAVIYGSLSGLADDCRIPIVK